MSATALRSLFRRTLPGMIAPTTKRSAVNLSNNAARSASGSPQPLPAAVHQGLAAECPLIPKEHLKIPIPDACQILQLPDGRLMSYGEYGSRASDARPFIFVHGIPDCRFDCVMLPSDEERARRMNIRWIGIDRPGMGLSTIHPGRTVTGWIDDLRHLINHLKLDSYRVLGVSGGTAYALAAAKLLPRDQLKSVGIMVGVAPWEAGLSGMSIVSRVGMTVYKHYPAAVGAFHKKFLLPIVHQESPAATEKMMRRSKSSLKQVNIADDDAPGLAKVWREAFRQGADGVTEDSTTATEPWGFELEEVDYPGIRLWYGSEDVNTPPHMGKWMSARLPQAIYREYPGKSHFTMWDHAEDVLSDMLSDG
jgi:pimeloyl-ACP methyl ester carboxylesterase